LASVDGKHVITVEGIGNSKKPHPVQERIAKGNGSQCGFCTPGIVMSLYALLRNKSEPTEADVEEAFDGNLCRCTGYRPLLDAAQSFSVPITCCKMTGSKQAEGGESSGSGSGENDASDSANSSQTSLSGGCCMQKDSSKAGCCMAGSNGNSGSCTKIGDRSTNPAKSFPSPEFIKYDPSAQLIFPPALQKYEFLPLSFGNKKRRWLRPVTLKQLLEIKSAFPAAKIIGGSTETQIETKFKSMNYSPSIYVGDIAELRQYKFCDDYIELGGNVSLTDIEELMEEAIEHYGPARAQPFAAIKKQLRYFAGRQIRNVGTPAGNLATASPISDLNPVFMATRSTVIAETLEDGEIALPMREFFTGYRKTSLPAASVITKIRIPAAKPKQEFMQAFKQAKRKDDDIAIVNAALRVVLNDDGEVEVCDLIYGGMAPFTIAAKATESFLTGKTFAAKETLEGAMSELEKDFNLPFGVPGGMATYRKTLALSFFYKFFHEVLASLDIDGVKADTQAVGEIERGISTGAKDHDATVEYTQEILGKARPHVAALKQTCGEAQYSDDIPVQHNELFGCMVLSTQAHAKLLSVDPSPALDMPGVKEWVDHTDLPNPKANWWGAPNCDEVFFAVDEVFTAGQPIGMILADTARKAEQAAKLVKIEYEPLPAIITIEEAIEKESYFEHAHYIHNGDVEAAFASSDHVFTGVSRMGAQEHFYLETQACVAVPKPEDGEMEVFSGTQNPTETQAYVAQVTGVDFNKVVCRVKRLGGGFGGKETRSVQLAGICAVAAHKTKKPVRCMLNRDEDMITSGQRHPFLCRWKIGVNKDGKLQALDADVFNNGGWSQDLSAAVVDRALSHMDGVYRIPNVHVRGRIAKTNTVSNTAFRGFGGPQGLFIAECYMSEVADHLGMDVDKLREINMYKAGEKTHFKQELKDWYVPLMWDQVRQESQYDRRRTEIEEFNKTHRWNKRGLAIVPTKFGISFTALFLNQAGALVHIYHDGSVLLAHGGVEMGQGLHTKMIMIAAEALKVPQDNVFISETATNTVANTSSTAASASSDLNGYAVWNACAQLNERLAPYREKYGPDAPMSKLAHSAYFDRVNLSAQGFYKTPDIGYVWGENTGQMFFYFTQGVTAAEVEIDTLTGDWTCLRADIKMDVGRSINPAVDYGQIEGAFIQGQGLYTTEEPLWLRSNGQMFTRGPGAYKIPGFRDVPQIFNVSLLKDVTWENLRTIQRSRGVGEPPLFMGSAVFFAIRDALKAARKQWGVEEVLRLVSPATVERIRTHCGDPILERGTVVPKEGEKSFFVTT
jgi:xanthine dehydrogenase/oxidase